MVLLNKDIEMLKNVENYLFDINKDSMVIQGDLFGIKSADIKDETALSLYFMLYDFIERVEHDKKILNARSNNYNKKEYIKT